MFASRTKHKKPDGILLGIVFLIILLGLFALASAATVGDVSRISQQIFLGLIPGIFLGILCFKMPLSLIQKWSPYLLFVNILLVAMIFLPGFSEPIRGGSRWLHFGQLSFQPSEFLKLTFILYVVSWLVARGEQRGKNKNLPATKTLLPFIIVSVIIGTLLINQPDLSTLGVILFSGLVVYFTARTPLWHTALLVAGGATSLFLFIKFTPYRLERITSLFNAEIEPLSSTYHIRQAFIAIGSGGIFGLGLGMSKQKFGFLPFPATDSIFAIIGEEMGFIGAIIFILLFLAFFWRGFLIAKDNKNNFARLLAIGISTWIFIQTAINIGVMVGIFPFTGIPLPFVSYGKSHLITELAAVGILLNASCYKKK